MSKIQISTNMDRKPIQSRILLFDVGSVSSNGGLFWSEMHSKIYQACRGKTCHIAAILALVLISVSPHSGFALDPGKNLRQYVLRAWTTEQGLPQDSIHAMLQTRDGFLWIGTRGGLARFDGASFILYKAGAPNSIPGESITGLAEDRDGSLWISSDGGLTHYRNGRFDNYTSRNGLPDNSIWRIAADPAGGVWAVTWRSQLFHFDGKTLHRYEGPFAGRPEEVNALIDDLHGTLWIATFDGLFALNPSRGFTRFTQKDGLAGDRVYAVALNHQGELWTAGDGGLTHLSSGRFTHIQIPDLPTATLLAFDPSGSEDSTVWTGSTGQGLFRLNPRGVQRLGAKEGLISDEIYLLYCTRDGSVWLGALNGLNQLSDGAVTSYSTSEGLPGSTLGMQRAQGPNDELWFGLGRFMAHVRDGTLVPVGPVPIAASQTPAQPTQWQRTLRGLEAIPVWVQSNDPGSRGMALIGTRGESVLSDGTIQRPLPPIPWSDVGSLLIGHDGTIWTAGSNIGVVAYPIHGPPHSYTAANGLDDRNVLALAEDAEGTIWVGTISGLNRIRNGIVSHVITCANAGAIEVSADGSLWVSSESGLIYVPHAPAPVRVFTQQDGLPTSLIEGVAEDTEGHLWLGTEQGIVRVDKADLLAPEHQSQRAPVVFGVGDGLRNAQLRINSVFRSRHGDIWFLTLQELGMIDPRRIQGTPLSPIDIDLVKIDDQDAVRPLAGPLQIAAGHHRLTIRYTLPEFQIPGRIHFRYRLEGWDKDWIQAGTLRDATYTGIPPGRYTFRVDHSDGYDSWSPVESTMDIRVAPYFYQTGWFLTVVALLFVSFIWQLHRSRVAQVSAQIDARMQERTRIARELHDTLLQGMLGVSMQMYAASQQSFEPDSLSAMLGRASQRLREIAEQSRRAVEGLRSPSPSPDSLEANLSHILKDLDLPSGIEPHVHSVGSRISLHPLVQIEIERIMGEAVANAVQHSGASSIQLDILYQPTYLFVSASDNGRGMEHEPQEAERHGHWGITGMQERARSVGGHLRILPNAPRGTVVELSLPGDCAYLNPAGGMIRSIWRRLVGRKKNQVDSL
jgi:ligand-binding sensor domain-containing protein/signal transduction histidine kinase